jgi:hypothetical protein
MREHKYLLLHQIYIHVSRSCRRGKYHHPSPLGRTSFPLFNKRASKKWVPNAPADRILLAELSGWRVSRGNNINGKWCVMSGAIFIDGQKCKTCVFDSLGVDPSACEECEGCVRIDSSCKREEKVDVRGDNDHPATVETLHNLSSVTKESSGNDGHKNMFSPVKLYLSIVIVALLTYVSMYSSGSLNKPRSLSIAMITFLILASCVVVVNLLKFIRRKTISSGNSQFLADGKEEKCKSSNETVDAVVNIRTIGKIASAVFLAAWSVYAFLATEGFLDMNQEGWASFVAGLVILYSISVLSTKIASRWATRGFNRKTIAAIGLLLIVVSGIFPPFIHTRVSKGSVYEEEAGYGFLLSPPAPNERGTGTRLDTGRLVLQWLVIAGITGLALIYPGKKSGRRQ